LNLFSLASPQDLQLSHYHHSCQFSTSNHQDFLAQLLKSLPHPISCPHTANTDSNRKVSSLVWELKRGLFSRSPFSRNLFFNQGTILAKYSVIRMKKVPVVKLHVIKKAVARCFFSGSLNPALCYAVLCLSPPLGYQHSSALSAGGLEEDGGGRIYTQGAATESKHKDGGTWRRGIGESTTG